MWAILSDVHGNLEALQAVLADIDRHKAARILCLGDTIGYGPNPRECLDLIRQRCDLVLLGNHDQATLYDPEGFSRAAEHAVYWTRALLQSLQGDTERANEQRWEFLAGLPHTHKELQYLFVHGSPRNPLSEYVFPDDVYHQRKMDRIFALVEHYCFQGHTHVPGLFIEQIPGDTYAFHTPEEVHHVYTLDARKTLCNVGSVGQPRDGDPRACYILLDKSVIRFRRVEYDIESTIKKIHAIPELEKFLGDRLRDGR